MFKTCVQRRGLDGYQGVSIRNNREPGEPGESKMKEGVLEGGLKTSRG